MLGDNACMSRIVVAHVDVSDVKPELDFVWCSGFNFQMVQAALLDVWLALQGSDPTSFEVHTYKADLDVTPTSLDEALQLLPPKIPEVWRTHTLIPASADKTSEKVVLSAKARYMAEQLQMLFSPSPDAFAEDDPDHHAIRLLESTLAEELRRKMVACRQRTRARLKPLSCKRKPSSAMGKPCKKAKVAPAHPLPADPLLPADPAHGALPAGPPPPADAAHPAPPAPVALAHGVPANPGNSRFHSMFGPHTIVELWSKGTHTGFSIWCHRHSNLNDSNECAADMTFGKEKLSEEEVLQRLKRWVVRGYGINPHGVNGRDVHMKTPLNRARVQTTPLSEEDKACLPDCFTEADLAGL